MIRRLATSPDDTQELMDLAVVCFGGDERNSDNTTYKGFLEDGRHQTLLYENNGRIIASVTIDNCTPKFICALQTHPDYRRKKLAWTLIEHLVNWANSDEGNEIEELYANIYPDNFPSISLFTSLGFTITPDYEFEGKVEIARKFKVVDTQQSSPVEENK